jgi:hypothetical protein
MGSRSTERLFLGLESLSPTVSGFLERGEEGVDLEAGVFIRKGREKNKLEVVS